jgi:hypothetical protein
MSDSTPTIVLPTSFRFDEVKPLPPLEPKRITPTPTPPLGVLSNFHGDFAGRGFNLIFRPNSAAPTTTTFTNPVAGPPIPNPPNENVLELNLTTETLSFSNSLGSVPNRGLETQNDIFLNGVPYLQVISDVTNPATGKADGPPTGIHFEPGLWMHIPSTKTVPVLAESLVRMASIPHGTTINAQGLAPTTSIKGPPNIPAVDITPFVINSNPPNKIKFASQTAASTNTPRIPQDLSKFIAAGTITQAILNDPNTILRQAIAGQNIVETFVFTVSTSPTTPEFGGGTDNIAFLEGDAAITKPNANAASMTATFWVETVEHKLQIPVFKAGSPPLTIKAPSTHPDQLAPTFQVSPPHDIPAPITITVHTTQIQYSQVVMLNFAGLTWPHVSVATLTPSTHQVVPPAAWSS